MKKTILFVAGSLETLSAVHLANRMGLHTVVSDGSETAACFAHCDDRILANTYDVAETLEKAKHFHETVRKLDGVICVASDVPLTVATVATELGLPGISIDSARLASDKLAMKNRFKADGVPVPWFKQITSVLELRHLLETDHRKFIIKPVDSRGARGVMRLIPGLDLKEAFTIAKGYSPSDRVMVEEFIDGPQISTESIVLDGTAYTPGFADRNYALIDKYAPFMIEDGGELPSALPAKTQKKVLQLVSDAAASMGIRTGVVKGDIVIQNGTPMVIEIAARLSGGYFCTHEIPLSTGVDFVGAAIRIAIGEPVSPEDLSPRFSKCISQRYLFPNAGVVQKIAGVDDVNQREEIAFCDIKVKPGDKIGKMELHPARAGMVIAYGENRAGAISNAENAVQAIDIEVV